MLDRTTALFSALSDPSRVRMLGLLSRHELSVGELTETLGLSQSRISTHLSRLKEAGLVQTAREGSSSRWSLDVGRLEPASQHAWSALAPALDAPELVRDAERAASIVARREQGTWPEIVAGEMEKHYSPGRTWESMARGLASLLTLGDVLDVGAGDGTVASLVASHAKSYTCVDASERLVAAAKKRLFLLSNVSVEVGDAEALRAADASMDVVFLLNVLSCLPRPARALEEAARVLRPGGRALIVTLGHHEQLDAVARYGHVHAGLAPAELRVRLEQSGLLVEQCAVTSRERREPRFEVVTALATKPLAPPSARRPRKKPVR